MKELQAKPTVCVSICEESAESLRQALRLSTELADIIELRLDCLTGAELDAALSWLDSSLAEATRPFIITLRPAEQGGYRDIDGLNRIVFWLDRLSREETALYDIEFDVARVLMEKEGLDWERVICSRHDFTGGCDLSQLYQEMAATPAPIIKLAVTARDATDCIPIFKLMERARSEGRKLIAVAMGEAGIMTRILGPSRGSLLTYAALDENRATAPGQLTASDLRLVYRVQTIREETTVYGIMGAPVSHSLSPRLHNAAFAATEQDAVYIPFEVHDAASFMRRMADPHSREISWKLRGLSVTAPHKAAVMEHLDWIEPSAQEIGAVNTIVIEGSALRGYNTDAAAFFAPLEKRCGSLQGKEVAIIGAGGAARAALWGLKSVGAKATVFARDAEQGSRLAEEFGASSAKLEDARFHDFEVVVNSTPIGTRGANENETPASEAQLRGARLAYDLVYNPQETRFLHEAREAGCETLSGLEMLVAQAAEQFHLWTGKEAPTGVMLEAARKALAKD